METFSGKLVLRLIPRAVAIGAAGAAIAAPILAQRTAFSAAHTRDASKRCGACPAQAEYVLYMLFMRATSCRIRMSFKAEDIGDLPGSPCQPSHISFPFRSFGKSSVVQRSFQASWFHRWKWLHYNMAQDAVSCYTCCKAVSSRRVLVTGKAEKGFLGTGFTNWKDASVKFAKHESSDFHKSCIESLTSADVGDTLNRESNSAKQANREYLLRLLSSVRFLARQGLALHGDGDEHDSNLHQLLLLRCDNFPAISKFLE